MDMDGSPDLLDAAIIGAAQRVEHYEMAAYGTVRAMAERLGNDQAAQLLQETLDEEKEADETLNGVAEQLMANMNMEEGAASASGSGSRSKSKPRTRTSRA
jgi:ferritin-like metal-binding protein YciE